jgi:hypothetical protein
MHVISVCQVSERPLRVFCRSDKSEMADTERQTSRSRHPPYAVFKKWGLHSLQILRYSGNTHRLRSLPSIEDLWNVVGFTERGHVTGFWPERGLAGSGNITPVTSGLSSKNALV